MTVHPLRPQDPLVLATIPLATGEIVTHADGATAEVERIEVVVTDVDGRERRFALNRQHAAWWAPTP